jgi:hypothetical protein
MLLRIYNGPAPTSSEFQAVACTTTLKTMLQVKGKIQFKIKAWGISFDNNVANAPVTAELIETGTVFGTMTAHVAGGLIKNQDGDPDPTTDHIEVGASATGYTCSNEGAITTSRTFDSIKLPPTGPFIFQWPLGQEPVVLKGRALRIRVKAAVAVNAICWVDIEI